MRPSADRRAAGRTGQAAPGAPEARTGRRLPGPAVHGHMSLRGRRRPAPARPHPVRDTLLRAAAGPRRPPRPRGDSTAATPPPPLPPPLGSRDPAGGGGRGSATFREPGSRREGEGAHGDAPCGRTWPRGPWSGPALLLSWAPTPAVPVLEKHFCPGVPTSRPPSIGNWELNLDAPASASLLPVARAGLWETRSRPLLIQECSDLMHLLTGSAKQLEDAWAPVACTYGKHIPAADTDLTFEHSVAGPLECPSRGAERTPRRMDEVEPDCQNSGSMLFL